MIRKRSYGWLVLAGLLAWAGTPLQAVKIAIVQYEIRDLNKVGVDAARMETFIREAAAEGAGLVVTPETGFYRYEPWEQDGVTMLDLAGHYDELKNKFSALADELDISLVIGLREPSGDKEKPVYNTALFFGPDGAQLGKQHKVFPSNKEMAWTRAGTQHSIFETAVGRELFRYQLITKLDSAVPGVTAHSILGKSKLVCPVEVNILSGLAACRDIDIIQRQHVMLPAPGHRRPFRRDFGSNLCFGWYRITRLLRQKK